MIAVVSCLAYAHDHSFVVVALLVCIAGSAMTMTLFDKTRRLASDRLLWALLSGVAGGTAIWTTHFVAMLGFRPPVEYSFDPGLTIASLVLAIVFTCVGLIVATRRNSPLLIAGGGGIVGLGVCVMHFTGMLGLQAAGRVEWDVLMVARAITLGIAFGAWATLTNARSRTRLGAVISVGMLVLAICSMHFTAMGAATFTPLPIDVPDSTFSSELLAICVVATISSVTGVAFYMIEERSKREVIEGLRHAAAHDALTGLPNRVALSAHLPMLLSEAARQDMKVGVVVVDLDRFKEVNDVYGHQAGDDLLRVIAARLQACLAPGEFLARVGGDEFVGTKLGISSPQELEAFASRLTRRVIEPVRVAGNTVDVGASIGLSIFPDHARDADQLIAQADLAMYRAKRNPMQKCCLYEVSMDEGRRTQSMLSTELRHAIDRGELELFYQPQMDVAENRVYGYEALLRWRHPRRGLVSAASFIPIAESSGLIVPIGEWVIQRACAEAAAWPGDHVVAVNVASAQLSSELPRIVHEALLASGLPARRLELEITESCIIDDQETTLRIIRQLRSLGVSIAMDDYGTGYSSLATLQLFTFDKIKIDRSFVKGARDNPTSAAIVRATIVLARSLGIKTLAEGVEHEDQLEFLRREGCDVVQGYLFSPPRPPHELGLAPAPMNADSKAA